MYSEEFKKNRKLYFDYKNNAQKRIESDFLCDEELEKVKNGVYELLGNLIYDRGKENINNNLSRAKIRESFKSNKGVNTYLNIFTFNLINYLSNNLDDFIGNEKQIELAEKLKITNLGLMYDSISRLGFNNELEYLKIDIPLDKFNLLKDELDGNLEKYVGNNNQSKLASKIGLSNFGGLYSSINLLGYLDRLKYSYIPMGLKKFVLLEKELNNNIDDYIGNSNQIKLAKVIGISNLGHLYASISALGFIDKLKYNKIGLPYFKVESLQNILSINSDTYIGDNNQIALSKEAGISNLGHLYSAVKNLGYNDILLYSNIDLPIKKLMKLKNELISNLNLYVGNRNQVILAKKVGITNLGQLNQAIRILGYKRKLGYTKIHLKIKDIEFLEKELDNFYLLFEYFNKTSIFYDYKNNKNNLKYLFTLFNSEYISIIKRKSISVKRLFSYLISCTGSKNFNEYKEIIGNIDDRLYKLNLDINTTILLDIERVLLGTYKKTIGEQKKAQDALNVGNNISYSSYTESFTGENIDPAEELVKEEFNQQLKELLPLHLYEDYVNENITDELKDYILENDELFELLENYK